MLRVCEVTLHLQAHGILPVHSPSRDIFAMRLLRGRNKVLAQDGRSGGKTSQELPMRTVEEEACLGQG